MQQYLISDLLHYCNISVSECSAIRPHRIPYYDLTYVTEGTMTYYADGKRIRLRKNDAIFLSPGTLRSREAGGAVRYVSFNFQLHEGVTLPFEEYMPGCITHEIRQVFSLFSQQHLSPKSHSAQKCTNLLNYVLFELLDARALRSHNPHVQRILAHIEEHAHTNLTLRSLSRLVGLTPEYTATLFKKEIGKTLTEYIIEHRLLQAKSLILGSALSLREVAARVGFESYPYFSRLFKKQFSTTPMQLRRQA